MTQFNVYHIIPKDTDSICEYEDSEVQKVVKTNTGLFGYSEKKIYKEIRGKIELPDNIKFFWLQGNPGQRGGILVKAKNDKELWKIVSNNKDKLSKLYRMHGSRVKGGYRIWAKGKLIS